MPDGCAGADVRLGAIGRWQMNRLGQFALTLTLAVGVLTGCAAPHPRPQRPVPASMLISKRNVTQVKSDLQAQCLHGGSTVVSQDDNSVSCRHVLSGEQGFWAQALLGNGYATTPFAVVRFSLTQRGADTRVDWVTDIQAKLPSGQVRHLPINDNRLNQQVHDSLAALD